MLVGILVILAFALPVRSGAGPTITFDKEVHDFGKVLSGEEVEATFQITNTGDEKLVIDKVRTSCGCTKTIRGSSELEPNGKSKIVAALDTVGMKAGAKKKTVTVLSNDPKRPRVDLKLLAEVIQELKIAPSDLAVRLGAYVEDVSFPVKMWNNSNKPVKLTGAEVLGDELVQAKLNPEKLVIEPGTPRRLSIDLKLKKKEGKNFYLGRIRVKTDHPREKEIGLKYLVHFLGAE
jgi:hypothetical protein